MLLDGFPPKTDIRKIKEQHNVYFIFLSLLFYTIYLIDSVKNQKILQCGVATYLLSKSLSNTVKYFRDE